MQRTRFTIASVGAHAWKLLTLIAGVCATPALVAAQVDLDFELGGPCTFSSTDPLREQYAAQGAHFSGPAALEGGAVLDKCGNFGFDAHSGVDFLAFNITGTMLNGGTPTGPQTVTFDQRIGTATIWACDEVPSMFLLEAYDGANLVDSDSVSAAAWTMLSVSAPAGFTKIVFSSSGDSFGFDDLHFEPVVVVTYCTAKVNSLGCLPAISAVGAPSASATSGFTVKAANVRNNKNGLLFYGINGASSLPFQGGTLCVKTPIRRTGAVVSGGNPAPANDCSGVYALDLNAFAHSSGPPTPLPALIVPGTQVNCQWWGRDPGFPAPNNTTLSDGLSYVIGP